MKKVLLFLLKPIGWLISGVASILLMFESTERHGKMIISGGDIGEASAAMKNKDYEKAYGLYRGIIERGDAVASELIAYKRMSWFYEKGVGVEKNEAFSKSLKEKAAEIEKSIYG